MRFMKIFEYEKNGILVQYSVVKDSIEELNGLPCFKIMEQFIHKESGVKSKWFDAEDFKQIYYKTEPFAEMLLREYLFVNNIKYTERSLADERTYGGARRILFGRYLDCDGSK